MLRDPRIAAFVLGIALALVPTKMTPQVACYGPPRALEIAPEQRFVTRPPQRFQGPTQALVIVVPDPQATCLALGAPGPSPGRVIVGCAQGPTVYVPSPCDYVDAYAQLLCHELAHVQGWPDTHPEK